MRTHLLDPIKVKTSIGDGFRGASLSIGEKSQSSKNEVRAYHTLIWQKNPKMLLPRFNLRSLTFENPVEEAVDNYESLIPGQYTFKYPIIIGIGFLNRKHFLQTF